MPAILQNHARQGQGIFAEDGVFQQAGKPVNWWKWGCASLVVLLIMIPIGAVYWVGQYFSSIRKKDGEVMAQTVANAAEQFFVDYGRLPAEAATKPMDQGTDTSTASGFIATLTGRETGASPLNTRSIDFLSGFKQAKWDPKQKGEWINGLVLEGTQTAVIDPWGKPFRVRLDTNGDGKILNPATENEPPVTELKKRVIIWSAGKDGDFDTWEDNPRSWE